MRPQRKIAFTVGSLTWSPLEPLPDLSSSSTHSVFGVEASEGRPDFQTISGATTWDLDSLRCCGHPSAALCDDRSRILNLFGLCLMRTRSTYCTWHHHDTQGWRAIFAGLAARYAALLIYFGAFRKPRIGCVRSRDEYEWTRWKSSVWLDTQRHKAGRAGLSNDHGTQNQEELWQWNAFTCTQGQLGVME